MVFNILLLYLQVDTWFKCGAYEMRKAKYWIKMNILDGTSSWISQCKHIGEAKLFGYILATFNRSDATWTHNKVKRDAACQLLELTESTFFNYLKRLTKSGLLVKVGKGDYRVNEEYVSYGGLEKNKNGNGEL